MTNLINKKVAVVTLGCKVNKYESDGMEDLLSKAGCNIVREDEHADIYIINTCSVTNMAEKKSRQIIHRMKTKNPNAIIVAAGCYVNAAKDALSADETIDIIVGNNKKNDIVNILVEYFENQHIEDNYVDMGQVKEYENFNLSTITEHTRAYVKIQDGCNQFCSYCIIPYTRGRIRSRKIDDVVKEVRSLTENGIKEIVFTGIHISSYGKDFDEDINLATLIEKVSDIDGVERIRLGSLEPGIITMEFVDSIKNNHKVCPHFHLSLQSACNSTLKRMNRKYTIEEYMEKVDLLRSKYDNPAITTDVIVGFPGETQEEFDITLDNLRKLNLYEMHIFKYSVRKGTVAEKMDNQVDEQIKNTRSEILIKLANENKSEYENLFVGKEVDVLFEKEELIDGISYYTGHSREYIKTYYESKESLINCVKTVTFKPL